MRLFLRKHKQNIQPTQLGFSLIELMVTITIVTLITGIVMVRYSSFNSVVLLKSQSYELALDIRTAQVYGVNAKGASASFRGAYGIYFDIGNPNQYILFKDADGDREYDVGENVGDTYTIDARFQITSICITPANCNVSRASIAFQRPDFDAYISTNIASGATQMRITISSLSNSAFSREVVVYSSGQISVQ